MSIDSANKKSKERQNEKKFKNELENIKSKKRGSQGEDFKLIKVSD